MLFQCQKCPITLWIKLQQVNTESYPQLQRLKRTLEQQSNTNQPDEDKKLNQIDPKSSSYISSIFSLQKVSKNSQKRQVKNVKRLLYHNYNKYKTIPFTYQNIYLPNEYSSNMTQDLTDEIFTNSVQNKRNFCFFAFGSSQAEIQPLVEGKQGSFEGLYYSAIAKLSEMISKLNNFNSYEDSETITFTINFIAASENKIIDLLDINNQVFLREDPNQDALSPLTFESAKQCHFTSNYELYTTFKRILFRKKELNMWSVLMIKINFFCSQEERNNKKQTNSVLLIEWVKQNPNILNNMLKEKSHQRNKPSQGEKSLLCLNQCILEIFKVIEARSYGQETIKKIAQSKQMKNVSNHNQYSEEQISVLTNLQCFRNSLITRILKPFLLFNSQVIFLACCSISQEHQNDSFQTLMLGKHLSNIYSLLILNSIDLNSVIQQTKEQDKNDQDKEEEEEEEEKEDIVKQDQKEKKEELKTKISPIKPKQHTSFNQSVQSSPKKNSVSSMTEDLSLMSSPDSKPFNKQEKVRQKLLNLLQQSKQKQKAANAQKYEFSQVSKKIFQQKMKSLKTKKQINMLQAKVRTKNLRTNVTQKQQSQIQLLDEEIKRLNFEKIKLQKQLKLLQESSHKLCSINNNSFDGKSKAQKEKVKIQKLRMLKQHLKNELLITEMEINQFLEEKESIKTIYLEEMVLLKNQQKQMLKNIQLLNHVKKASQHSIFSSDKKSKKPRMRLIKEMQPFYQNSLVHQVRISLDLDKNGKISDKKTFNIREKKSISNVRYSTEESHDKGLTKSFEKQTKPIKEHYKTVQLDKIKKSRSLIRKRSELKQKLNKGRADYLKFLQDTTQKYNDYSPSRQQSNH